MAKVKPVVVERPYTVNCGGPSKTIASHAEGNSVREIVGRFRLTGTLPQSLQVPQYFDTTKVPSLLESLNIGSKFNVFFSNLPAAIRDEFRNDPKRLMTALSDPDVKVKARLLELGILTAPPKEKPALGSKENPFHTVAPVVSDLEDSVVKPKGKTARKDVD